MNGLAVPSGLNRGRWAGTVGSGRAAGWLGAAATDIPGLGPSDPFSHLQLPRAGEGDRDPGPVTLVTPVWLWRRESGH